jgi:cardiolipin synthase
MLADREAGMPDTLNTFRELRELPWWVLLPWGLGVLTASGVLFTLFSSVGRRPRRMSATECPPVGSEEFVRAIANTVNGLFIDGGAAELLNNGVRFFPAMFEAIREAKESINFLAYIWKPGKVSDEMFAALTERARAGVEVRVLLDGMGGIRAPTDGIAALRAAGGKVERFRALRFGKITRFYKRMHRRAIVIDGRVGFTGGAAVGDQWLGDADTPEHWRDCMVRVTGPLATSLQSAFAAPWANSCGEILVGPRFYPEHAGARGGDEPVTRHVSLVSSPSGDEHPLRVFFLFSFLAARERLYVASSYFVPDKQLRQAAMDRAKEGVDVRILIPGKHTDAKPIRQASHSYYDDLLSAGVRIFEYQPTMFHMKTLVVDGKWSVVGSANMDIRSKELNQENVLGILDSGFARQVEDSFLSDLKKAAEIRLSDWRRRGVGARLKERAAALFAEQY